MTPPAKSEDTDAEQRKRFREWVKTTTAHFYAVNGWSVREVAKRAGVHHDTLYAWMRKGDKWAGGKPKSATVMKFCDNLGLEPFEPFEILGWGPKTSTEPQPIMPQLARDLARFLLDPNVDANEKRLVETFLVRMIGPHRRRPPEDVA